jgi:PAS domain S-box-containing protein
MTKKLRSTLLRYGLPVVIFLGIILIAVGIKRFFAVSLDPTTLLIVVLIVAAWYGGRGPGLLVGLVYEITIQYFAPPQPLSSKVIIAAVNRVIIFVTLALFVSSRRKAQKRVQEQREWLQVTLSSIGDAVIATDIKGNVSFMNPTAETLTGWTMAQAVGKPLREIFAVIKEETGEPIESPLITVNQQSLTREFANHSLLVTKDNRKIPIESSSARIKDTAGKVIGVIVVFRDTSERHRAEREREQLLQREQEARAEAESASQMKDEFLATVSHELRTPLNAILGWAKILANGDLQERTLHQGIGVIERNAKAQAELINDILDVSRIITGRMYLDTQPLDLASIIQTALDTLHPAATAKGISLTVTLDRKVGFVIGDAIRLQQVIWNLVANAIKFTPENGQVEVRLQQQDSQLILSVKDSGIGIKKEFLPYVFDRFRQADSSTTRVHSGLGLGLAIVRHLVELHGGTVAVASDGIGLGALFTVRLPVAGCDVATVTKNKDTDFMPVQERAAGIADLRGLRVLIVDDEADTRDLLIRILNQHGAETRAAASSTDALQTFLEWQPDVLLSDLGMPFEDGFALIRRIRAMSPENGGHIPAVALTAYVSEEDRRRSRASGFELHIAKPVEPQTLVKAVANLAKRKKQQVFDQVTS